MAFLDKLNSFANAASEKASGAIEIGKLNMKINAEEKKISEATQRLGAYLLNELDGGSDYVETIMSIYGEIKTARETIAAVKSDIANLSGEVICPHCEEKNPQDSKFCRSCGASLLMSSDGEVNITVEPLESLCPNCGSAVGENVRFCTQCGTRLD